ncbi:hypothetical protein IAT40_005914 [Kwoniella sp. CBS 6097]
MKGFAATALLGFAAWLGRVQVAAESGVYLSIDNVKGTVYYDLVTGGKCDARFGPGWGLTHGNHSSACEAARGSNFIQQGVANAVAMNRNFVDRDLVDFCGRIVKVYKPNGEEYRLAPDKPFFIWDGCEDCAKEERIDLGADAIADLQSVGTDNPGQPSGCDNPLGLRVEIMNEYFWQLEPHGVVNESPDPVADPNAVYPVPTPADYQKNGLPAEYQKLPPGVSAPPVESGASASASASATGQASSAYGYSSSAPASVPSAPSVSAPSAPSISAPSVPANSAPSFPLSGAPLSAPSIPIGSTPGFPPVSTGAPGGYGPGTGYGSATGAASSGGGAFNQPSASSSAPAIVAVGTSGSASATATATAAGNSTEAFQAMGQKADCEAGEFMCEGLQLKVCNFIQPGMPDLGWVNHVTCATVCDVECDFTCE